MLNTYSKCAELLQKPFSNCAVDIQKLCDTRHIERDVSSQPVLHQQVVVNSALGFGHAHHGRRILPLQSMERKPRQVIGIDFSCHHFSLHICGIGFERGRHPLAGRRNAGLSLWNPGANWLAFDNSEPEIEFLPSNLWIIGLGNLGQAYLWMLATLPYLRPEDVVLVLQDYDRVAKSNDSTSMLTQPAMIGRMKSRAIAEWLEARKFKTILNEHRFGNLTHRSHQEPPIALCGVDNPEARSHLETAGFGLVVEAGLGSGVQAFKNFSIHSFPSSMSAVELWSGIAEVPQNNASTASAYAPQQYPHLDECGLAQLASRTVGVPFVGLTTAALVIAELLRRLHSGTAFELVTGSLASPEDMEVFPIDSGPYEFGYTKAESNHRTVLSPV